MDVRTLGILESGFEKCNFENYLGENKGGILF